MAENNGDNENTGKTAGRLPEVDVLKGIGILLMVAGHMHFSDAVFNKYIFGFHMPLFFLVSGYLYRRPHSFGVAALHKARSLLIPYFAFGISYWILWIVCGDRSEEELFNPLKALLFKGTDGIPCESALWFLLSLFVTYVIYIWIDLHIRSERIKRIVIAVLTIAGCILTRPVFLKYAGGGYCTALSALGFFYFGTEIRKCQIRLNKYSAVIYNKVLFAGIVAVNTILIFVNGKVNMRTGEWAVLPLSYFNALVGTWIYAELSVCIVGKTKSLSNVLQYVGKNAIVFVCTNHLMIRVSEEITSAFLQSIRCNSYIMKEIFVFVIAVGLMSFLTEMFNRSPLRIMVGR